MRYKLTRYNPQPAVTYAQYYQGDSAEYALRECFTFCPDHTKAQLEAFIESGQGDPGLLSRGGIALIPLL